MTVKRFDARTLYGLAAVVSLLACGNDPNQPTELTVASVAGTYRATTLTTTTGGTTTDQLAAGASLNITLSAQGATSGRLIVPPSAASGAGIDADLTGIWSLSGTTVRFANAVDSFVRDMPFEVRNGTLVGDHTFGSTRIRVTLTRQ